MYNKSEFLDQSEAADLSIGVVYVFCFIFGVPSNILALLFFVKRRQKTRNLTNTLCILTALQDTITSLLSLNHGVTLLKSRDVWLPRLCPAQHILFQMSQRMSVFLVAALSGTRAYILVYPLRRVRETAVLSPLLVVWVLMTCFFVVPPSMGLAQITYHWNDGYCWAHAIPGKEISYTWDKIDQIMDTIGLACPIIPISISCIISVYKIRATKKTKHGLTITVSQNEAAVKEAGKEAAVKITGKEAVVNKTEKKAAVTKTGKKAAVTKTGKELTVAVILITVLYIVSNIPLFINYILYLITIIEFTYPGPIYSITWMYFYSWNITALLTTGLNASANPVVYFTVFRKFRQWITGRLTQEVTTTLSSEQHGLFVVNKSSATLSRNNLNVKTRIVATL